MSSTAAATRQQSRFNPFMDYIEFLYITHMEEAEPIPDQLRESIKEYQEANEQ